MSKGEEKKKKESKEEKKSGIPFNHELWQAVGKREYDKVREMLEDGRASIDSCDEYGQSLLMIFLFPSCYNPELAQYLLDRNCDVNIKDQFGRCVLHFLATDMDGVFLNQILARGVNLETLEAADTLSVAGEEITPLFKFLYFPNVIGSDQLIRAGANIFKSYDPGMVEDHGQFILERYKTIFSDLSKLSSKSDLNLQDIQEFLQTLNSSLDDAEYVARVTQLPIDDNEQEVFFQPFDLETLMRLPLDVAGNNFIHKLAGLGQWRLIEQLKDSGVRIDIPNAAGATIEMMKKLDVEAHKRMGRILGHNVTYAVKYLDNEDKASLVHSFKGDEEKKDDKKKPKKPSPTTKPLHDETLDDETLDDLMNSAFGKASNTYKSIHSKGKDKGRN